MDKKRRRVLWATALLVCLMVLLHTGVAFAQNQERRVLRVAFPELPGISETDRHGNRKGLLVDYLNEISNYTDWGYEYIPVDGHEVVSKFLEGEFDLMGGSFYSPTFEQYFAYPHYSMGRSRAVLLSRKDDDRLSRYDLSTLNGKTIGVYEQAKDKIRYLREFLDSNDLNCDLRYYSYDELSEAATLYPQLTAGEIDMILANESEIGGEFRAVTSFQAQPYYIVTARGNNEVLDGLNTALYHIQESTPYFVEEVYNKNFPDIQYSDIQFNREELAYIADKGTVTVAVPTNWHPIHCQNSPVDHHEGLLPELLRRIASFTDLTFRMVYTDTYAQSIEMVARGEADVLGVYLDTKEQAFAEGFALTRPYIELSNIVLKHKAVDYPSKELVCGILSGHSLHPGLMAAQVRRYNDAAELIKAVNCKEVDYAYGLSAQFELEMQSHRYLNVAPVTHVSDSTDATFAVARPANPELLTILNKAIGSIPSQERSEILDRNLVSVGYRDLSFGELVYANPAASMFILGGVLLLAMTVVLLIISSRMRSAMMQSQLKASEAKSRAKSDFLSKMSHEIRTPMNAIVGLTDLACMERDIPPAIEDKLQKIRSSSRYLLALINDILDMSRIENGKIKLEQERFSLSALVEELREMMGPQAAQRELRLEAVCRIEHEWLLGDSLRLRQILINLIANAIKFTPAAGLITLRIEELTCDGVVSRFRFSVRDTGVGIPPEAREQVFSRFEQLSHPTARSEGTGLGLSISRSIARLMGGDLQVDSKPGEGSEFYMTLLFPLGGAQALCADPPGMQKKLSGMRVLLAEDNDLNAEIAQELLASQGVQVCRVADGGQAVERFTASAPGEFDAILMDIQMPVMDGHRAAREIRAAGRPDSGLPIIAMTANSFKEDEAAARAAGMDGFVPKPIELEQLFSVLRGLKA